MHTPQILLSRRFSISELPVQNDGTAWTPSPEYDEQVRVEWDRLVRAAKHRLWDGTYYRVLNPEAIRQPELRSLILLGTIAYRYIATFPALFPEHSRLKLDPLHHLSTVALIKTSDDFYAFGARQRNGAVDLFGGGAQLDEMEISSGADLERNLYKELLEEAGLQASDFHELAGIGIVVSSTSNVLVVGHAELKLDSAEMETKFKERREDEMERLILVRSDKVRAYLAQLGDYRKLLPELEW